MKNLSQNYEKNYFKYIHQKKKDKPVEVYYSLYIEKKFFLSINIFKMVVYTAQLRFA